MEHSERRRPRLPAIVDVLYELAADIAVLSEITEKKLDQTRDLLDNIGLVHQLDAAPVGAEYGVLVAEHQADRTDARRGTADRARTATSQQPLVAWRSWLSTFPQGLTRRR